MKKALTFLIFSFVALAFAHAETITFSADSMTAQNAKAHEYTRLLGNAHVVTETMQISADVIELSGTNFRYIKASGNVSGINSESGMDFTCGIMEYDRESKIAHLKNSVHLVDNENDVTADAQLVDYDQNTEVAILQISVYLVQKDNTCTASYALYHKKEQLLTLTGNPRVSQGSDTFRAQEIRMNLNTEELTLDGRVRGSVTSTDDEQTEAQSEENSD